MKADNALPPIFLERLTTILSKENYERYLASLFQKKYTTFRINTLKTTADLALPLLTAKGLSPKPLRWCNDAYMITEEQRRPLTATQLMQEGLIYIQNPSSLFASLVLDPHENEEVLDLAAAPGGKTLHLAALMNNKGRIAAVEVVKERFFRLKANIKNAGATMVVPYHKDGSQVGRLVPERFDRVLLDAPCSSEGRFNLEDPTSYKFWSEKKITEMSRKQKQLIHSAIQALKPGGTLVYCTCSFAPEENELLIDYALKKFPNLLEIQPIDVPFNNYQPGLVVWEGKVLDVDINRAVRIIPNESMNGFFICKLLKK